MIAPYRIGEKEEDKTFSSVLSLSDSNMALQNGRRSISSSSNANDDGKIEVKYLISPPMLSSFASARFAPRLLLLLLLSALCTPPSFRR